MSLTKVRPPGPVLVTGGSGFLGTWMTSHLRDCGATVVTAPSASPVYCELSADRRRQFIAQLSEVIARSQPDSIVHCAGSSSVPKSFTHADCDFYGNVLLTHDLIEAAARIAPSTRLLFISSAAVYGQPQSLPVREDAPMAPMSPYGVNKQLAETLVRNAVRLKGLRTAILRVFSAYGRGLRRQVVWDITEKAKREGRLQLQGSGGESRDFIHASDVASAARLVLTDGPMEGEAYNVASGQETTIAELAGMILREMGSPIEVEFGGSMPVGTPSRWRADVSRIRSLGFEPATSLASGVREVVQWHESLRATT